MREVCCALGEQIGNEEKVLYRSDNFSLTPALGQMGIEGYLLICSNKHYIGLGDIPREFENELELIHNKTKELIGQNYSSKVVSFEHGPKLRCGSGGVCLDHAHLHVIPTRVDVVAFLKRFFKPKQVDNFSELRDIYAQSKSSYLFVENQNDKKFVFEIRFPVPSQYIRQIIAAGEGRKTWDWRIHPDLETFEKTLKKLRGKLNYE